MSSFVCQSCGSPSIETPTPLTEASEIHCSGCARSLGSWGDFKRIVSAIVLSDENARPSADPLPPASGAPTILGMRAVSRNQ